MKYLTILTVLLSTAAANADCVNRLAQSCVNVEVQASPYVAQPVCHPTYSTSAYIPNVSIVQPHAYVTSSVRHAHIQRVPQFRSAQRFHAVKAVNFQVQNGHHGNFASNRRQNVQRGGFAGNVVGGILGGVVRAAIDNNRRRDVVVIDNRGRRVRGF